MNLLRRTARRLGGVLLVAGLLVSAGAPASAADKAKIIGSGSTFSQLLLDQWRSDTRSKPYSLDVNYQGTGSTQGRQSFLQKTVDFAASDIPYQAGDEGVPPAGSFRYITAVAGALGMMFNITDDGGNRVTDLTLTPEQVCRIFTEQLVTGTAPFWDELVPGQGLPHIAVKPVVRGDGSGTSYVLSEFCIATAPSVWAAFKTAAAANFNSNALSQGRPISTWPAFPGAIAGTGSTGIAGFVSANDASANGRITYIEAGYTEITQLPLAKVTNAAGIAVEPTPGAITAALSHATIRGDGTFQLHFDDPDRAAYYPSTYSYLIVPSGAGGDAGKGRTLAEYVYYALTFGQDQAEPLKFARLSTNLIADGLTAAAALTGAPTFDSWAIAVGWNKPATAGGQNGGGDGQTGGGGQTGGSGGQTGGGAAAGGPTADPAAGGPTGDGGQTLTNQADGAGGGTTTPTGGDSAGATTTTVACAPDTTSSTAVGTSVAPTTVAAGAASTVEGGATTTAVASTTTVPCTPAPAGRASKSAAAATKAKAATGSGTNAAAAASGTGTAAAGGAAGPVKAPGPSNAEAVWTVLQGAAVVAAGLALRRTLGGARA